MKNAEEWIAEWQSKMDDLGYEGFIELDWLKAIQQDAYKSGWLESKRETGRLKQSGEKI